MEKRTILAFALSALLLFVYVFVQERFFTPPPAPPKTTTPAPSTPGTPPATSPPAQAPENRPPPAASAPTTAAPLTPPAAQAQERPRPPARLVTVDSPLYHAVVSSEGGKLQEWTLKYRGEKPLVAVGEFGPGGLQMSPAQGRAAEVVPMRVAREAGQLGPDRRQDEVVLEGEADGVTVRETLRFHADAYTIDTVVQVENRAGEPRTVTVALPWSSVVKWGDAAERFIGQRPTEIVWTTSHDVQRSVIGPAHDLETDGAWIGLDSVWYLSALLPKTGDFKLVTHTEPAADGKNGAKPSGRATIAVRAAPTLGPGQSWTGQIVVYAGPKEYERLHALGLEKAINFGGFPIPRQYGGLPMEWLGVPILLLLQWVYRGVGNYGVAIILLTVVSKVLFYPLTVRSMRSMKAMQQLSPQINALRSKYKSDPQRLQRETMELYRQYKVNPMGGCLPMIAQVPIFYALYLALSVSVELQSAPFLCVGQLFGVDLWICDLASHDPTYVLPIMMGITMFIQQKMTPAAGDPRQAKMMLVMPFVFTFMFLNLPSGLVLYWTVSNVLQIAQQWYMDRPRLRRAAQEVKNATRA